MVNGIVKWFDSKKGYGFITAKDGSDIFVHYSALKGEENTFKTLYENDKVEYDVVQGKKGPQASNVVVIEREPRKDKLYKGYR
ncbi:MAG: cold-shock protein [Promethearchaeota archaeon]